MLLRITDRISYICVKDVVLSGEYVEAGPELPQVIK
jgi:hypothetical protein